MQYWDLSGRESGGSVVAEALLQRSLKDGNVLENPPLSASSLSLPTAVAPGYAADDWTSSPDFLRPYKSRITGGKNGGEVKMFVPVFIISKDWFPVRMGWIPAPCLTSFINIPSGMLEDPVAHTRGRLGTSSPGRIILDPDFPRV